MKSKWQKPELVVLVKVQTNEMVLEGCKIQGGSGVIGIGSGVCMNAQGQDIPKACRGHSQS